MADEEQRSNINDNNIEGDEMPNVPLNPFETLQQQQEQQSPAAQPQEDQDKYTFVRNIIDWFRQNFIVGSVNERQTAEQARALLTIIHEQMSKEDDEDEQFLRDNFDLGPLSGINLSSQFVMHLARDVRPAPATRKCSSVKRVEGTPVLNVYASNFDQQQPQPAPPPSQQQPCLSFGGDTRPLHHINMSCQTGRICNPSSSLVGEFVAKRFQFIEARPQSSALQNNSPEQINASSSSADGYVLQKLINNPEPQATSCNVIAPNAPTVSVLSDDQLRQVLDLSRPKVAVDYDSGNLKRIKHRSSGTKQKKILAEELVKLVLKDESNLIRRNDVSKDEMIRISEIIYLLGELNVKGFEKIPNPSFSNASNQGGAEEVEDRLVSNMNNLKLNSNKSMYSKKKKSHIYINLER